MTIADFLDKHFTGLAWLFVLFCISMPSALVKIKKDD